MTTRHEIARIIAARPETDLLEAARWAAWDALSAAQAAGLPSSVKAGILVDYAAVADNLAAYLEPAQV